MLNCSNVGLDNRNKIGAIIVSLLLILVGFFFFMGDDEEEEEIEENNIPADTRITDDSLEEVSNSTNDEPCKCIDIDNSCTDGDDDWGYYPDKPSEDENKEEEK